MKFIRFFQYILIAMSVIYPNPSGYLSPSKKWDIPIINVCWEDGDYTTIDGVSYYIGLEQEVVESAVDEICKYQNKLDVWCS